MSDISVGMIVRYAPNWCSPGERKYLHVVTEAYADVKRCKIRTLNTSLCFAPTEVVDFEMVEPTGFDVNNLPKDLCKMTVN